MKNLFVVIILAAAIPVYAQDITPTPTGCWDPAPGGPVELKTASPSGKNNIVLTWTPAPDPVSYYLLSYGTEPGMYIYGNPDMGGQGTTSYTVGNLSTGKTYYFAVRAGNGCTPGTFSNELSAVAGETPTPTSAPTEIPTPTPVPESPTNTPAPSPMPQVLAAETSVNAGQNQLISFLMLGATAGGVICAIAGVFFYLQLKKR